MSRTTKQQLVAVITELLATCELNLDELEPATRRTIDKAERIRDAASKGRNPK
jgi:hypothetical protein